MVILAPENGLTPKLPPVGSPVEICGNDGQIRVGSQKLRIIQSGFCPNNPTQRIPSHGFIAGFPPNGGGAGGGAGQNIPSPKPIPVPIPNGKVMPPPPPPIAKIPKLPPLPPLPPAPQPPSAAPSAGPGTAAGGGGAAGGGILLLIGLALLASFGRR